MSDLDVHKNEIIEKLKSIRYNDLEDMVYRMQLTYHEIIDILDMEYISSSTIGYTIPPCLYGTSNPNLKLKSLFPNDIKLNITIDDNRLRSISDPNKTRRFTEKKRIFLYKTGLHSFPFWSIR